MFFIRKRISKDASFKLQANKVGPIGMDIGMNAIHLCQLQPLEIKRFAVVAKATIPFVGNRREILASPKRLKKLLAQGMKQKGFIGRKMVTVMPADELKIMPITYKAKAHDVDQEILKMLNSRVDGNVKDYVIDYVPVRSNPDDEENLALAAIARRDNVIDYLQAITLSGFEVDALDVGPAAIRRLICTLYTEDNLETVLVINTGLSKSYLTIISGRRLLFDQQVSFGESLLLDNLSATLELPEDVIRKLVLRYGFEKDPDKSDQSGAVSDDEISYTLLEVLKPVFIKLVDEINRVLIFTASQTHGMPISRVCLLGSIARWPGAESLLRKLIDIPFSTHQRELAEYFVDLTEEGESWSSSIPELAVATGLALRGLDDHE
ncbi:MAG: pilus assembly protein PilM [Candidatus Thiodiazotropha sp. (ex Dulcina madagascariensis)]|nr:pilus assembly protein PilM [Candidatus Thiodiazotropha sp. (ex Dulcina madagascariensis)]MCU7925515.1 pilus assembly protein PilM [Candidatus Thiodiazotropha sp. (ex Dulcina madagascariensis)]